MDKRYLIVTGALMVQATTIGCVFAYGIFFTVLEAEFGWSRTLLSVATSIAFLNMGFFAIAAGRLSDRFGPRGVLTFTAISTALAYILMYFLSAPWQLVLIYGLLVGFGLASHDVVTLSTVARWFPKRRGIMSGVVKVGTAIGQMSIPVVAVMLIAAVGWRSAFLVMGVVAGSVLLLAAWLVGVKPDHHNPGPDISGSDTQLTGHLKGQPTNPSTGGLSFAEARQSSEFWILCAIQFFFFGSLITIPTHIVPHSIDSGLSPASAAAVLSTIAASSIAGRLLVGHLVDRIGGKWCFNLCLLFLFISLVLLVFITHATMLYFFGFIYGFAHGGLFTVVSPTVAEYFGMKSHGAIFGVIVCTGTVLGSLLPIVTGLIFDKTQSYDLAYGLLATMVLVSFILSLRLSPRKR